MRIATGIRKSVKFGGAASVVLLAVVWVASGWWWIICCPGQTAGAWCSSGQLEIQIGANAYPKFVVPPAFEIVASQSVDFWWGFGGWRTAETMYLRIPLWIPTVLTLLITAAAWWLDRRVTRRARIGRCSACGYDRRGLAEGALCPECGAASAGVAS